MINSLINQNRAISESYKNVNPNNCNLNQEGIDNNAYNANSINFIFSNNINENNPSLKIKKSKYI